MKVLVTGGTGSVVKRVVNPLSLSRLRWDSETRPRTQARDPWAWLGRDHHQVGIVRRAAVGREFPAMEVPDGPVHDADPVNALRQFGHLRAP